MKSKIYPSKDSHAQYYDDLIIRMIFDVLGVENPSYLDIGANHPVELSNTYYFYERGSKGVLVEPTPELTSIIKKVRPDDVLIPKGVAGKSIKGNAILKTSSEHHVLNSFLEENIEHHGIQADGQLQIELVDINDIISEHFITSPDFISMDTEGMELDIFQTFQFDHFNPSLFCIEIPINEEEKQALYDLLKSHNYHLVFEPEQYGNVFFVNKSLAEKLFSMPFIEFLKMHFGLTVDLMESTAESRWLQARYDELEIQKKLSEAEAVAEARWLQARYDELEIQKKLSEADFAAEVSWLQARYDELEIQKKLSEADFAAEVSWLQARCDELKITKEGLSLQIQNREQQISALKEELEGVRETLMYMENSLSWRLTRPIRFIRNLLKR